MPYPNNAGRLAMKAESINFISHWFDLIMGLHPPSPAHETCALPIRPPRPVWRFDAFIEICNFMSIIWQKLNHLYGFKPKYPI